MWKIQFKKEKKKWTLIISREKWNLINKWEKEKISSLTEC